MTSSVVAAAWRKRKSGALAASNSAGAAASALWRSVKSASANASGSSGA